MAMAHAKYMWGLHGVGMAFWASVPPVDTPRLLPLVVKESLRELAPSLATQVPTAYGEYRMPAVRRPNQSSAEPRTNLILNISTY